MRRHVLVVSLSLLLAACASTPAPSSTPRAPTTNDASISLHGKPATEEAIVAAALASEIVWLGEKHDDAEHHRLQAKMISALAKAGARPAVVFEMIEDDQQSVLDELAKKQGATPDDYRAALAWDTSGWPPFALYAPIFAAALEAKLKIVAGNAPKALVKQVAFTGKGAGDLEDLSPDAERDLKAELAEAHCGMLPPDALPAMALAQRVRDARIAEHARQTDKTAEPRAVVIAGNGHVRIDRGAPWAAGRGEPGIRQFALSFHEAGETSTAPYDAVWTTPAMPPEDHCKDMHVHARPQIEEKK